MKQVLNPTPNLSIVKEYFEEVWNKRDINAVDRLFAADGLAYGLTEKPLGHAEYKAILPLFLNAMPNIHIEIVDAIEDGDRMALHCKANIDTKADSPQIIDGIGIVHFRNGQILYAYNLWDFMTLLVHKGTLAPDALVSALSKG